MLIIAAILLLAGCQNGNSEIEALKRENAQLKEQIERINEGESSVTSKESIEQIDNLKYSAKVEGDGTPVTFGNSEHIAELKSASVAYSPRLDKYLLKVDFHFINKSDDSANFINDLYCNVIAYQAGIELDTPGIISEEDIYDCHNAYKNIKGAEIDAQLAFVLNDTKSDIELELGSDYYSSLITKKIIISKE